MKLVQLTEKEIMWLQVGLVIGESEGWYSLDEGDEPTEIERKELWTKLDTAPSVAHGIDERKWN